MKCGSASDDFVVTKSSSIKKNSVENFECVVYESHKSKKQSKKDSVGSGFLGKHQDGKMDIKKLQHDIFKFAVKGMNPEEKREANMKLAIKLGARPPKKEYINYKTLKMQKEIEKKERDNIAPDDPVAEVLRKKKKHREKESRNRAGKPMRNILEGYGKPGQVKRKKKKKKR